MRLRHPDGSLLHLAYCSNVHPADDLDGIAAQLERFAARVRERARRAGLGVGLWVAAPALADPAAAERLRDALDRLGLEVVTLNGFPYRAFHAPVVKLDVYRPNWADRRAARLHARPGAAARAAAARRRRRGLDLDAAARLAHGVDDARTPPPAGARWRRSPTGSPRCEAETGKRIRLALEPEPGCTIETVAQAAAFLAGLAPEWIGLCLDACHLAVQFEDAGRRARAAARRRRAGGQGAGLERAARARAGRRRGPRVPRRRSPSRASCTRCASASAARVAGTDDLPEALAGGAARARTSGACTSTCRSTPAEHTTQDELRATLRALVRRARRRVTRHLEVETYTWGVLPDGPGGDDGLVEGLAAELAWTRDRLVALGAEEVR